MLDPLFLYIGIERNEHKTTLRSCPLKGKGSVQREFNGSKIQRKTTNPVPSGDKHKIAFSLPSSCKKYISSTSVLISRVYMNPSLLRKTLRQSVLRSRSRGAEIKLSPEAEITNYGSGSRSN